jgi:7-cyano-7-deazaguanine synthase
MKVLVLISGGLDSSVLLARAVQMVGASNVVALNIYYGQKHAIEMECAKFQCEKYGVELINADLSQVFKFDTSCPLLAESAEKMPEESYAEQLAKMGGEGTVKTYIPFRNGLFLSYATAVALQLGAKTIIYGAHADDAAGRAYPDCTPEFYNAQEEAIERA